MTLAGDSGRFRGGELIYQDRELPDLPLR